MPSSDGRGFTPRVNVFTAMLTFLTGVGRAPVAWWREDAPVAARAALAPFPRHSND